MTAYDVQVGSATGSSGDTLRIEAEDAESAGAAALTRVPEGWVVANVSDATDHGEAWGVDTTTNEVPPTGRLIEHNPDAERPVTIPVEPEPEPAGPGEADLDDD